MSGGVDPSDSWAAARRSARAEVAGALAPRGRICPRCGAAQDAAATRHCSRCGAELVASRAKTRLGRRASAALALAAIALTVATVAFVSDARDDARREERAAARAQLALEAAERRRLIREGRPRTARLPAHGRLGPADARRRDVRYTERLITEDARSRARAGALDGPVIGTRCLPDPATPTRRALERDPAAVRLVYGCIALKSRFEAPPDDGKRRIGLFGHPFRAVVEPSRDAVTWCRVFPPAGEGALSLATPPLDPACRARAPARAAR